MTPPTAPTLRVITPDATPEETAAILATVTALIAQQGGDEVVDDDTLHEWVHAARLKARRAEYSRGPWRLSGRMGTRRRV